MFNAFQLVVLMKNIFSNGHSIKDKNHTKAGATKERKVTLRRFALRRMYLDVEMFFFSIKIVFTERIIAFLNRNGTQASILLCPIPVIMGIEIT